MRIIILLLFPFFGNAQIKKLQYQWTKISGPAQFKIQSPQSAHTEITNLAAGTYQFELKVTNSNSLSARDTMILTVKPPINKSFYTALHT